MKRYLIPALAAAALYGAAPAGAEPSTDAEFLRQLANHGFDAATGSQGLITAGHIVCNSIDANRGSTPDTLQSAIAAAAYTLQANNPRLSVAAAFEFVAVAVVTLCPWDTPRSVRGTTI